MFIALLRVFSCEHCSLNLSVNHGEYRVMTRMTSGQENKSCEGRIKAIMSVSTMKMSNSTDMEETCFRYICKGFVKKRDCVICR